jgi:hypothetical protein
MNRFYRVAIVKRPVGTAIEHREPAIEGDVLTKVTDSATAGDYKLIVVDATDDEHQANLAQFGVQELSEDDAAELAPTYRPQVTRVAFNPETMKEERLSVPAADLRGFVQRRGPRRSTRRGSRTNR